MSDSKRTIIVGAGVAGLVAAIELEKRGYAPRILEATDKVGGRVKTDHEDGFQYDHGFQVLLTAYPEAQRYLDLNALQLKRFRPGALIRNEDRSDLLADPLREPHTLFKVAFSHVGTLSDKWKIYQLTKNLKAAQVEEIFKRKSVATMAYLQNMGFSQSIIQQFFQPFFGGIFLEKELETSSRMFEFVFKMFSEGHASVPNMGMQAIPDQLFAQLKDTEIVYNTRVKNIRDRVIQTTAGDFSFDSAIVATDPAPFLSGYKSPVSDYQSTVNMYFSLPKKNHDGYISLVPGDHVLINNFYLLTDIASSYAPADRSLLSVSILGMPGIREKELILLVTDELKKLLNIDSGDIEFKKLYRVDKALPNVETPVMDLQKKDIDHGQGVYLAGDYLPGGSLNGAMLSGRRAAEVLTEDFELPERS